MKSYYHVEMNHLNKMNLELRSNSRWIFTKTLITIKFWNACFIIFTFTGRKRHVNELLLDLGKCHYFAILNIQLYLKFQDKLDCIKWGTKVI